MKHKFSIIYLCLVFGIVLLGWGVFAKFSAAGIVVTPTITPNPTTNNQTMMLKHSIAYRRVWSNCDGGCHLDGDKTLVPVGRYLGEFVASWRNCDNWTVTDPTPPGYTMTCQDAEGAGKFVSAFGILISTEAGKFKLLMPLSGLDIMDIRRVDLRSLGVQVPLGWNKDTDMMWTAWDIVYQGSGSSGDNPSGTYSYTWAGYVGGGCINSQEGLCGRVALEHNFILAPQP